MPKTKLHKSIDITQLKTLIEAHQCLGHGFSPSTIQRRINTGEYRQGKHWFDVSSTGSRKRIIKVDIDAIAEAVIKANS